MRHGSKEGVNPRSLKRVNERNKARNKKRRSKTNEEYRSGNRKGKRKKETTWKPNGKSSWATRQPQAPNVD
jgi:hypothetical protein